MEFSFTMTRKVSEIIEEVELPAEVKKFFIRIWQVHFDGNIPWGESGNQAVEIAKKAVSQNGNIPITQLLSVMGSPGSNVVNVFMLKEEPSAKT